MSWKASAYVKSLVVCPNGERLSRTEKLVALVLADSHQDKVKAFTFPDVKTIAEDSLMDPRVCRRVLAALERKGVIERERAEHQGRGQITFYRFPALDQKGGHHVPLSGAEKGDSVTPFPARGAQEPDLAGKGGADVPLFFGQKEDGRRTEGGRKEDKTAPPSIEEQEQEQEQNPIVTEGGGASEEAIDAREAKTGAAGVAAVAPAAGEGEPASAAPRNAADLAGGSPGPRPASGADSGSVDTPGPSGKRPNWRLHAALLMELLGLAAGDYDLGIVAQVIGFESRAARASPEQTTDFLRRFAMEAIERGEIVNAFWFRDRKFAVEGSNGTSKRSPAKQRVDENRRAVAEALAKRGISGPWDHAQPNGQAVSASGRVGVDRGVHEGPRTTGPEVLPPER